MSLRTYIICNMYFALIWSKSLKNSQLFANNFQNIVLRSINVLLNKWTLLKYSTVTTNSSRLIHDAINKIWALARHVVWKCIVRKLAYLTKYLRNWSIWWFDRYSLTFLQRTSVTSNSTELGVNTCLNSN